MSLEDDVSLSPENFDIVCQDETRSEKTLNWNIVHEIEICDLEFVDFDLGMP